LDDKTLIKLTKKYGEDTLAELNTLVLVTRDFNIAKHCQRIIRFKDSEVTGEETL
jgi:predicted ABC-type transport system involved in lysophospholipase L1 biosynthesis ATPase subunit